MYEIYESLFDHLAPKGVIRMFETLVSARTLRLIAIGTLAYSAILFFWHAFQLLDHCLVTARLAISPRWHIAVLALLTSNLHLRFAMAA